MRIHRQNVTRAAGRYGILTRIFLEKGANVNIGDNAGVYPFHLVEQSVYPEVPPLQRCVVGGVPRLASAVADSSPGASSDEEGGCSAPGPWVLKGTFM